MNQERIPNVVVTGNITCEALINSAYDDHLFSNILVLYSSSEEGIDNFVQQ
jgi:hypothetical protein